MRRSRAWRRAALSSGSGSPATLVKSSACTSRPATAAVRSTASAASGSWSSEEADHVARGLVGPAQVLEHEHHRPVGGEGTEEALEQAELGHLGGPALVPVARAGGQRRQEARQLGPLLGDERLDADAGELLAGGAQGRGHRRERQVASGQLHAAAHQHGRPAAARSRRELLDEPGLADPGLAHHEHRSWAPAEGVAERRFEAVELSGAAHEGRRGAPHARKYGAWAARPPAPGAAGDTGRVRTRLRSLVAAARRWPWRWPARRRQH